MTRESGLWRWLKGARRELREELHMNRVENSAGSGMPDVEGYANLTRNHGQFWIELKTTDRPATEGGLVRFKVREAQIEWLPRRWEMGGNVWLLLQVGSGSDAARYLLPGSYARAVEIGMPEEDLRLHCRARMYSEELSPRTIVEVAASSITRGLG